MESRVSILNVPDVNELWAGIGGHFDSLGQIINEFIDNSVSNFTGNDTILTKNIVITLCELQRNGSVKVIIEDSGTGIRDLNVAFTLGGKGAEDSPLNEHGFGLKHALASANPANDSWKIYTRTAEDVNNNCFKKITAPYKLSDFEATVFQNAEWPGLFNGTGTLIEFICSPEMYRTIARGFRGGITSFERIADILCEDIGFVYSGVIKENKASITMKVISAGGESLSRSVGALEPDWEGFIPPGAGSEKFDLGSGELTIEYKFGKIRPKTNRINFDNSTASKYYMKNMSSSGVEIRINGRVLSYNLFQQIWGIEKHNSYNHLLIMINLKSSNRDVLPKTRTSKNGLREGDLHIENLYAWIRGKLPVPEKDISLAGHETDLFDTLRDNMLKYNPDTNKVITTEQNVFTSTGDTRDRVRIDLYQNTMGKITIYEGKKDQTHSKDVYQLRMYWDGLVYDGIKPDCGVLVASTHPKTVSELIAIVNTMKDTNGNNYNFELKTWRDLGLSYSSEKQ